MACLWSRFLSSVPFSKCVTEFLFYFLQHDFKNFLKQKDTLLNLEREAMKTEDDILQIAWQKDELGDDRDEDDDLELLNSFFKGIALFH